MTTTDITQSLLAESAWIQRLARSLVRDVGAADDLAQETLIEAVTRPPAHAAHPRGWLASVLRRRIGHRRREDSRRATREQHAARREDSGESLTVDGRMHRHAELVRHVQSLAEPYKTAIVLRFFDDLAPREIAKRQGVPVNTVHSRLQRGLDQLRERLDAGQGGREEWLAALTAVGWPRASGSVTSTALIGVSVFMQTKVIVGAAVVLVIAMAWFLGREEGAVPELVAGAPALQVEDSVAGSSDSMLSGPRASTPGERASATRPVSSAEPATHAVVRRGRVVDARGRPLASVPVLHRGSVWPVWQSGDLGWINDGLEGLFLPPSRVEELRADPKAAEAFFARFQNPRDWRAVVFGEPLPERTVTSDADGHFEFAGVGPGAGLELSGHSWLLLAQADSEDGSTLLIAARAVSIAGRVLDGTYAPLPTATVSVRWSRKLALAPALDSLNISRLWTPSAMNADDDGRYLLRSVPVGVLGVELRATAKSFEPRDVLPPATSSADFDIVLSDAQGAQGLTVDGVVLDPERTPVAKAEVVFGRERVQTDANGRFAFVDVEPDERAKLTAIQTGFGPVQLRGLVAELRTDPRRGRNLELRFTDRTLTLRGVVLDAAGAPLAGVNVNVFDPVLLDITFTPLEGRLGGWERAVTTDPGGRFELGGLSPRDYRLRVWREDTSFLYVSEPFPAKSKNVTVQVPGSAFFASVRGRVTSVDGALPADLKCAVVYPIHITHGGGGSMGEGSELVDVAADGTFELRDVPRRHAEIVVGSTSDDSISLPVESIPAAGTIEIAFRPRRILRIVGQADNASASIVDADQNPLQVELLSDNTRTSATVLSSLEAEFPPCAIPKSAVAILLQRADGSWSRIPIEDDSLGLSRAMLPR
ncbi:MAG: sigma-70 family RNA polymerase sigma factor [Planctomycetota bacterium]